MSNLTKEQIKRLGLDKGYKIIKKEKAKEFKCFECRVFLKNTTYHTNWFECPECQHLFILETNENGDFIVPKKIFKKRLINYWRILKNIIVKP